MDRKIPLKLGRKSIDPRMRRKSSIGTSIGTRPSLPIGNGNRRRSTGFRAKKKSSERGRDNRRESMSRRSTFHSGDKRSDPRKLNDKTYMQQSVHKLIFYLAQNSYDQPISPKVLTRPANKDYFNILRFLLKKVDPHLLVGGGKDFTKRVPQIFKSLRYPFGVSKAALTFVGVPHTWPALLGTLSWLVELLSYDEAVIVEQCRANDFEVQPEKLFFSYLGRTYKAFLQGLDEESKAIEDEIRDEFSERNEQIKSEVEATKERVTGLEEESEELQGVEALLLQLRGRKTDYENDLLKFKTLIKRLEEHTDVLQQKHGERELQGEAVAAKVAAAHRERAQLQLTLQNQELSPADVQRLTQRRQQLKRALSSLRTDSHEREQKMIWDLEIAQTKQLDELRQCIASYNDMLHQMELAPHTARYAGGNTFHLELDVHAESIGNLLSLDLEADTRPALLAVKKNLLSTNHVTRAATLLLREECDVLGETIADWTLEVQELQRQLKRQEDSTAQEQNETGQRCQDTTKATDEAELQIQRNEVKCSDKRQELLQCQAELQRLRKTEEDNRARYATEEQAFTDHVVPLLSAIADHKEHVQEVLQRAVDHSRTRLEEMNA